MENADQDPLPARAPLAPVERRTLHAQVVERLRDLITEGALAPGERLSETRLCAELGVSRTPFREALKTLSGEGLIELRSGRGAVVRRFPPEEVRGMLEVLAEIEALAGRLACERASPEAAAAIAEAHERMVAHHARGERLAYYKLNQRIHAMIAEASGNATLVEVQAGLQARMKRIRFIGNSEPRKWRDALAEHQRMVDALARRDGEALAAELRRHIENTWTRVADCV